MTEESLPLIDPKPQHDAVQSFCAANARKLALLLVLLLSGSLGLGAKLWLDNHETTVSLDEIVASHEVLITAKLVFPLSIHAHRTTCCTACNTVVTTIVYVRIRPSIHSQ